MTGRLVSYRDREWQCVRGTRIPLRPAALLGMALCWSTTLSGLAYPLHMVGIGRESAIFRGVLVAHLCELLVLCVCACAFRSRLARLPRRGALVTCGVIGSLGATLLALTRLTCLGQASGTALAPAAAGLTLVAAYAIASFVLWSATLHEIDEAHLTAHAALSYALFAAVSLVCLLAGLRDPVTSIAFPLVQAMLALAALPESGRTRANKDKAKREHATTPRHEANESRGEGEARAGTTGYISLARCNHTGHALAVMACIGTLFTFLGTAGSILFGHEATGGSEAMGRKIILQACGLVIFALVGVLLARSRQHDRVLLGTFAVLTVIFAIELLCSPYLFQLEVDSADLPSVIGTSGFQVFTWLVIAHEIERGRVNVMTAAPLYLAVAIVLPKLAGTLVSVDLSAIDLASSAMVAFLWSACATLLVVVAAFVVAFLSVPGSRQVVLAAVGTEGEAGAAPRAPEDGDVTNMRGHGNAEAEGDTHGRGDGAREESACETAGQRAGREGKGEACVRPLGTPARDVNQRLDLCRQAGLSQREIEVFLLLSCGYTAKRIAEDLFVSVSTVQTHIKRIYAKFGVHSKQQLLELINR